MAVIKFDPAILKGQLNQTSLQQTNQPLYQILAQLIAALSSLNVNAVSINNPSTPGKDGKDGIPAFLLNDGGGGSDDGGLVVPGPAGIPGTNGTTGAQGPIGPVYIVEDGLDGLDGQSIPVQGPQGITGNNGRDGTSVIFFAEDGLDGDNGRPGATGAAGSNGSPQWILIASSLSPSTVNHVDFTGLAGYTDIRVVVRLMTYGVGNNDITALQVSIDNGATFLSAATDYRSVVASGQEAGIGSIPFYNTAATAGRSGETLIEGFNLTNPKVARSNPDMTIIPSASALNAIRVLSQGTNNFTGGDIYVFGR